MSEYNDSHMLSKTLERIAAQATHLKEKIDAGLEIPSWAEYKIYSAYEGVGKALGTAYSGPSPMEEKLAAVFSSALNRHPALKGKQSTLPDKIQAGIVKKRLGMKKAAASPKFYSDGSKLYHDVGGGVTFSLPEGAKAEQYKRQVEKERGYVGSTAPTSKDDHPAVRAGKSLSRVLDKNNPNRPRYRSLKDLILRRPDPNYRPGAEVLPLKKQAAATATKTDPQKWEQAKAEARAKMGGKHSARAMQLATQIYKKDGGGYSGSKPTASTNSLKKWTKQDWNWTGGDKPGEGGRGVYLPKKKADNLRKSEEGKDKLEAAARKKSKATREGKQYSSHGLAKGTSLRAEK
jgi:hypothetical protein